MQWRPKQQRGESGSSRSVREASFERLRRLRGRVRLPLRRPGPVRPDTGISDPPNPDPATLDALELEVEEVEVKHQQDPPANDPADGPLTTLAPDDPKPLVALPAVVARARPLVRQLFVGLIFAIMGVVAMLFSSVTMLRLSTTSRVLPAVGNLAAMIVALVCLAQWRLWYLALQEWRGKRDVALERWLVISRVGAWVAGAAMVLGMGVVGIQLRNGWVDLSWMLSVVGVLCMTLGATLGAIHWFRPGGPPGVPAFITRNRRSL